MALSIAQLVDEAAERVEELNPIECQRWIESRPDALVVDIREPNEYREGAIAGAIHVPRGMIDLLADHEYIERDVRLQDRNRPILLYCRSGLRSVLAADVLQRMGFVEVVSMVGGITDWKLVNLPLVEPPESPFA
ncbi:MAG: rhodanese-like domain-containing protein [Nitrospirota bacterium]|jgi:rhodanese-related sulfurtransferase